VALPGSAAPSPQDLDLGAVMTVAEPEPVRLPSDLLPAAASGRTL